LTLRPPPPFISPRKAKYSKLCSLRAFSLLFPYSSRSPILLFLAPLRLGPRGLVSWFPLKTDFPCLPSFFHSRRFAASNPRKIFFFFFALSRVPISISVTMNPTRLRQGRTPAFPFSLLFQVHFFESQLSFFLAILSDWFCSGLRSVLPF